MMGLEIAIVTSCTESKFMSDTSYLDIRGCDLIVSVKGSIIKATMMEERGQPCWVSLVTRKRSDSIPEVQALAEGTE